MILHAFSFLFALLFNISISASIFNNALLLDKNQNYKKLVKMDFKIIFHVFFVVIYLPMVISDEVTIDNNVDNKTVIATTQFTEIAFHQCHPRFKTLEEIREILDKQPCNLFANRNRRQKRFFGGGGSSDSDTNNHINAIYGKITEHRDMINVLTNSSINTTIMLNAIRDHHAYTLPNFSSWRDVTQIILVIIILMALLYLFLCRSPLKPWQTLLLCMSKKVKMNTSGKQYETLLQQLQQQLNRLEQQFDEFKKQNVKHRRKSLYPSVRSINSDMVQYNKGYMSE